MFAVARYDPMVSPCAGQESRHPSHRRREPAGASGPRQGAVPAPTSGSMSSPVVSAEFMPENCLKTSCTVCDPYFSNVLVLMSERRLPSDGCWGQERCDHVRRRPRARQVSLAIGMATHPTIEPGARALTRCGAFGVGAAGVAVDPSALINRKSISPRLSRNSSWKTNDTRRGISAVNDLGAAPRRPAALLDKPGKLAAGPLVCPASGNIRLSPHAPGSSARPTSRSQAAPPVARTSGSKLGSPTATGCPAGPGPGPAGDPWLHHATPSNAAPRPKPCSPCKLNVCSSKTASRQLLQPHR